MADLTDARINELVKWTVDSRNVDMCAIHTALKELVELRAARAADEERVMLIVFDAIAEYARYINGDPPERQSNIATAIATRAAKQLAVAAVRMPSRKEWDCAAHDSGNTQDDYESSDYVDGWNEALDAVEAMGTP